jgi:hypothetical protein
MISFWTTKQLFDIYTSFSNMVIWSLYIEHFEMMDKIDRLLAYFFLNWLKDVSAFGLLKKNNKETSMFCVNKGIFCAVMLCSTNIFYFVEPTVKKRPEHFVTWFCDILIIHVFRFCFIILILICFLQLLQKMGCISLTVTVIFTS